MRITLLFSLFISTLTIALSDDEVLFTVGNTPVMRSEFEYIYNKNNFNNKSDYSRQSLQDYLDLYVNFRLKVNEALSQGLDQGDRFKDELATYESQLLDSYLDKEVLEKTIKQEYERSKTDVSLSHIFFKVTDDSSLNKAYNLSKEMYSKIKSGLMAFEDALPYSDDKQTVVNNGKGYLGWYNSLQIALPELEDAAYALQPGQLSQPVKTRLGYHLLKLNEVRPARKKLRVAIIKRFFPIDQDEKASKALEDTMNLIYNQLKNGAPFDQLVQKYSDDDNSKANGGQLEWFGINTYAKVFEDNAYALKKGEFSEPFKTKSAWYIIKLIDTSKTQSFEEAAPVLKAKLVSSPQYQSAMDQFIAKLKSRYNVKVNTVFLPEFKKRLLTFSTAYPFQYRDTTPAINIMTIGAEQVSENDLGKLVQQVYYVTTPAFGEDKYDAIINKAQQLLLINHYKEEIKKNNGEFRALMDEYRNGIMIFDLSEKNIWSKASEDSAGLLAYYNENKEKFIQSKHGINRTVATPDSKSANAIYKFLKENPDVSDGAVSDKLMSLGVKSPEIRSQVIEEGKSNVTLTAEAVNKPVKVQNSFVVSQLYNIQSQKVRAFDECRGYVVAAYQEKIEKQWMKDLRAKYPVVVNQAVFEKMIKKQ